MMNPSKQHRKLPRSVKLCHDHMDEIPISPWTFLYAQASGKSQMNKILRVAGVSSSSVKDSDLELWGPAALFGSIVAQCLHKEILAFDPEVPRCHYCRQ